VRDLCSNHSHAHEHPVRPTPVTLRLAPPRRGCFESYCVLKQKKRRPIRRGRWCFAEVDYAHEGERRLSRGFQVAIAEQKVQPGPRHFLRACAPDVAIVVAVFSIE
jgi:hypothetical protein